ncbi:MAG: hypothetical protein EXQ56_04005 [Acidobacteria bacterium]|nr:hypothetical protein [Acidobacteriota bacterium]
MAVGRTVFDGNKIEEFQVEILGVLRNVSPRKDLILSRVSGGPLERTGVMAGMSGSPVYIDGKLVGAVSMTFQFIKEPIAGITPIENMIDSLERTEPVGPAGSRAESGERNGTVNNLAMNVPMSIDAAGVSRVLLSQADISNSLSSHGATPVVWGGSETSLMPVATPLNLSGFTAAAIEQFAPQFKALGWVPLQGGGQGGGSGTSAIASGAAGETSPPPTPLPGSMISVQLVRGDMGVAADGTVTHVENGRIYAFGHPFLSAGPVELPFTEATVIAAVPSYANSMKISTQGRALGVISQDQASGIGGVLGRSARMIPVELEMISDTTSAQSYKFEVAADRFLLPFLMNLTVFSAIGSRERQVGDATFIVEQDITLRNLPPVQLENYISGPANGAAMASRAVITPLSVLMQSGLDVLDVERIKLKIQSSNQRQSLDVEQVWSSRRTAKPGEPVELTVVLRDQDGLETIRKTRFVIPLSMRPGPLSVLVADGTTLDRLEAATGARGGLPKDPALLVKAINRSRSNNRLYVRLARPEVGFMVQGESLPSLPPSVVSTLSADPSVSSNVTRTGLSTIEDQELDPVAGVISGFKALSINIEE